MIHRGERGRPSARLAFGGGLASVALLGLVLALAGGQVPMPQPSAPLPRPFPADNPSRPCIGGYRYENVAPLDAVMEAMTLRLPHHELANPDNVRHAWICTQESVHVSFTTGVEVILALSEHPDLTALWRSQANDEPGRYTLTTVQGHPGVIVDFDGDSRVEGGGSVSWLIEGRSQLVVYNELRDEDDVPYPLSTLKEIAESVRPYEA